LEWVVFKFNFFFVRLGVGFFLFLCCMGVIVGGALSQNPNLLDVGLESCIDTLSLSVLVVMVVGLLYGFLGALILFVE